MSTAQSRFEALRATTTPLVGSDEELDLLLRQWQQAKAGDGQVVLISGEPGIGKSRIAQTILERLSAEPHVRLRYFCSPHHQDSALYPSISRTGGRGARAIWGAIPVAPMTQTTVTADQRAKRGRNRSEQGSDWWQKPIS